MDNASELRAKLEADGVVFVSETDTEVLVHLIARSQADSLEEKVREALKVVEGTYGIAVMHADFPDRIVVARNGSPVVLGIGEKEMFVASDVAALVAHTRQIVTLDDGEMATLKADDFRTYTTSGTTTTATPETVEWEAASYDMGGHDTYMHKEISEQAEAVDRVLRGRIDDRFSTVHLGGLNLDPREARGIRRVKILGCGTSYHAGLIGAGLIEGMARIPADAEPASEFRYRNAVVDPDTLYIAVSQSGETYDVLAAVQELKRKGARVLGVVNVVGSAIAREADGGVYVHAGPEVCVVSTKCFTNTVVAFALLAVHLGRIRDLSVTDGKRIIEGLRKLPAQIQEILEGEEDIKKLAAEYAEAKSMMFIGRVRGYPVALEASLKLKEISYIHAEAYPASELKHGPLALIEPHDADGRDRPRRRPAGQEPRGAGGDQGPQRPDPRGRPPRAGEGRPHDHRPQERGRAGPDPDGHPAPAAGVPHRPGPGPGHRQAAQPGEVGHGRVGTHRTERAPGGLPRGPFPCARPSPGRYRAAPRAPADRHRPVGQCGRRPVPGQQSADRRHPAA